MAIHRDLPDSELHEVKGAAFATPGTVLTSIGQGKTGFRPLPEFPAIPEYKVPSIVTEVYTEDMTYRVPEGINNVRLIIIGGGGSGSIATSSPNNPDLLNGKDGESTIIYLGAPRDGNIIRSSRGGLGGTHAMDPREHRTRISSSETYGLIYGGFPQICSVAGLAVSGSGGSCWYSVGGQGLVSRRGNLRNAGFLGGGGSGASTLPGSQTNPCLGTGGQSGEISEVSVFIGEERDLNFSIGRGGASVVATDNESGNSGAGGNGAVIVQYLYTK